MASGFRLLAVEAVFSEVIGTSGRQKSMQLRIVKVFVRGARQNNLLL
jgi:hypothetical protein